VHEGVFKSFGKNGTFEQNGRFYDVLNVDLETAVEMLKQARKRASATPVRELGPHPEDGTPVAIFEGRYGPFVRYGAVNVTIPKGTSIDEVKLEQVAQWAADKLARGGPVSGRRSRKPQAPANGQQKQRTAPAKRAKAARGDAPTESAVAKSVARTKSPATKGDAGKAAPARKTAAKKKSGRTRR
jgi:DNA topoisomerase-1